jgi:hypothetical protein
VGHRAEHLAREFFFDHFCYLYWVHTASLKNRDPPQRHENALENNAKIKIQNANCKITAQPYAMMLYSSSF